MKQLLLLLAVFWSLGAVAQDAELDSAEVALRTKSINKILKREKGKLHDSIIAEYYLELAGYASNEFDFGQAVIYCDTILTECKNLSFLRKKEVEEQKATYLREGGESDEAIKILLRILGELEDRGNLKESADLNKRIGIIFLKMRDLENAEYHLLESIQQAKKTGEKEIEGYANMSLGNRYKAENRFEEAEKHYKRSIEIAERYNIKRLLAGNYNNYGSLLRMKNELNQSMEYYKRAVEINKEIGNDKWLSYNYNNLGNIFKAKENYQEALRYFFLSTEIKNRLGDYRGKVQTIANIAETYGLLGNHKLAYEYQKKHTELADSVAQLDNVAVNKRLAAEFQAEKREARIQQLNMQDELNKQIISARDERIAYQSFLGWIMVLGIFLVLIIALLLWRTTITRKKINAQLRSKNAQIDQQHTEILSSISYARRIQNSILPSSERQNELLGDHAILFKPKDIISGDFYVCDEEQGNVFFATVDCTGHGVPGAMVSLVASSHINKMLHEYSLTDPGEILTRLNEEIPEALAAENEAINDGMDMALCALNPAKNELSFAGAFRNCWVLNTKESLASRMRNEQQSILHEGGSHAIIELKGNRQGIGKSSHSSAFDTQTLAVEKGDTIVLTTDGYADQFGGPRNKKMKIGAMRQLLFDYAAKSPKEMANSLDQSLVDWIGGGEQIDDICVIVVRL